MPWDRGRFCSRAGAAVNHADREGRRGPADHRRIVAPGTEQRVLERTAELEAANERARALAGRLDERQLNWQPRPDQWSVGQCLDHLRSANDVYLPPILDALKTQRPHPVQAIELGRFSRWFIARCNTRCNRCRVGH